MSAQGSQEWLAERAGKITASRFADAIAINSRTGKPTEARNRYMRELAFELTAGQPKPSIDSQSLTWGKEVEAYAREAYELATGDIVREAGFALHPAYPFIGASPDGLIGEDGGYESKCPKDPQVHILTMLEGMPEEHIAQVQGGMMVTGRKWWSFVSYDPRQSEPFRLYIQRIPRDDAYINNVLLPGLLQFWAELQQMIETLRRKAA